MSLAKSAPTGMGLVGFPGGTVMLMFTLTATCPSCPTTPCAAPATPTAATASVAFYPGAAGPCPPLPPAGAPTFSFTTPVAVPACTAAGASIAYTVAVPVPVATPLGTYCAYGTVSVTFSDGMTLSASGDTKVCIVQPGVPRLSLTLVSESAPRRAPGDMAVALYSVRNNDPSNSVQLTAIASSRQSAIRPQGGNEQQGVFAIANPFGDDFPIQFNPGANCIPLPEHPYTQALLSNTIPILAPGQSNIITVGIRSYGQCANGSCSESTLTVIGTFSDNTPAMACAGMALIVDTSEPSQPCGRAVNDCNQNGIPDALDIAAGRSQDRNYNAMPDECEESISVPGATGVTPTNPLPGGPIFVQVFFNEAVPMVNVWANGVPLTRSNLGGLFIWQGTIPADTRPGPQTAYITGKDQIGSLALTIAPYQVIPPPPPSVTFTVPAGGCISIADNFYFGSNTLEEVLVLPDAADGTTVYKWNSSVQAFEEPYSYLAGFGWFSTNPDPSGRTLRPGDGALIENPNTLPLTFTFTGAIQAPPARTRSPAGLYLVGCPRPLDCGFEELMGFSPIAGDQVIFHDHPSNCYSNTSTATYTSAAGWTPFVPVLTVGKAAFVSLVATGTPPVITPTVTTLVATEVPDYAVDFDGVDDEVHVGTNLFFNVTNSFTIELWVNPAHSRTETPEATSGISAIPGHRYAVFPDHGYDSYRAMDPAGAANHAGAGLSIGTNGISVVEHGYDYLPTPLVHSNAISGWTHVALVYINKTPLLYTNGVRARIGYRSTKAFVHASANLGGSIQGIGYGNYQGQLDEVRIWNRALNETEVMDSMNGRLTGAEPGLVAYYRCDENSGTSIEDSAPASPNNPGILTSGAVFVPSGMPPPSSIYGPRVTLNGLMNPGGIAGTVWFEWGATTNYGNVTAAQAVAGGSGSTRFFQTLTGLAAGSYHFRAVGSNSFNVSFGLDQSFTLLHGAPPLRIETLPAGQVRLLWSTNGPLFRLQASMSLNPAVWSAVQPPGTVVGTNRVVIQPTSSTARFYRLINP